MKTAARCWPALARRSALYVLLCLAAHSALAAGESPREADVERLLALRKEALAHEHGEGVAKDPARAAKLYCCLLYTSRCV